MIKDKVKKESEILREICEWLENNRFFFWRSNNIPVFGKNNAGMKTFRSMPKFSRKGVPDVIIIHSGNFIGIEVKRPKAELREEQAQFRDLTLANGGDYYVATSIEDIRDIMRPYLSGYEAK